MEDPLSDVGGSLAENVVALGSLASTDLSGSQYVPDEKALASYDATPKADLNQSVGTKINSFFGDLFGHPFSGIADFTSATLTKIVIVLIVAGLVMIVFRKEIREVIG